MKWCRKSENEIVINDNSLISDSGGKNSLERRERERLVREIVKMLPAAYRERETSFALSAATIRPVKSIRHPHGLMRLIRHIPPGMAFVKLASREVEVAVLKFKYRGAEVRCACSADGKMYWHRRLYLRGGLRKSEFWMPIYDLDKSSAPSHVLREIRNRLLSIVSP